MNFESAREKDIYLNKKEKATHLSNEIICMLRKEHISLSETRSLFNYIVTELEDTPL